jgi:hypothetical protein
MHLRKQRWLGQESCPAYLPTAQKPKVWLAEAPPHPSSAVLAVLHSLLLQSNFSIQLLNVRENAFNTL